MGKRRIMLAGAALAVGATGVSGMAFAHGRDAKFRVTLAGTNEVPVAADPDGSADVKLVIDLDENTVCYDVKFDRTGTPNRGHIHKEVAGKNGPIVIPFFDLQNADQAANAMHDVLETGRVRNECVTADATLLADIVANPQDYYVNFHNARYPGGAIRGQLG
jgi:hypothetical protein